MAAPRSGKALSSRQYRGQVRVDATEALKHLERVVKYFETYEFSDAMEEVAKIGVESMQKSVLKNDSAPFSALARRLGVNKGPGRYRTGKMYNSIGSRLQPGPKTFKIIVGYIKGTFEEYFKFQDRGFWNKWELEAIGEGFNGRVSTGPNAPPGLHFKWRDKPKWTEGTYALRDARQNMLDAVPRVVKKFEKKIRSRAAKAGKRGGRGTP